eukprot:scaffold26539_cov33-Tisochrysis_lutea.AAC.4
MRSTGRGHARRQPLRGMRPPHSQSVQQNACSAPTECSRLSTLHAPPSSPRRRCVPTASSREM